MACCLRPCPEGGSESTVGPHRTGHAPRPGRSGPLGDPRGVSHCDAAVGHSGTQLCELPALGRCVHQFGHSGCTGDLEATCQPSPGSPASPSDPRSECLGYLGALYPISCDLGLGLRAT